MSVRSGAATQRAAVRLERARTFPVSYVLAAAMLGVGVAWLDGRGALAVVIAVLGVVAVVLVAWLNHRVRRLTSFKMLVVSAALQAYGWAAPDPRRIRLREWVDGVPTWVRLVYPRSGALVPGHSVVEVGEALSAVLGVDLAPVGGQGRVLTFTLAEVDEDEEVSAEDQRVVDVVASLLGATSEVKVSHGAGGVLERISVRHQVPVKVAAGTFRGRVERTVTAVLDGAWRATWDLQSDRVVFERRPELPDYVPHPVDQSCFDEPDKIPFGVDENGGSVFWDLRGPGPHMLVTGKTGTGKTVTINGIVMEWARRMWGVLICDPKRIEFLGLRGWPNVRYVATTVPDQVVLIHQAHEEMERRYKAIERGGDESDLEPLLLVLDEYRNFVRQVTAWYATVKVRGMPSKCSIFDEVAAIAEKGRSARVHLMMGTQRPDAEYLGGGMRDNFDTRISNGRLSPQGAIMMWDSPHLGVAVPRGKRGRGTAITSTEKVSEVQIYWTPDPRRSVRDGNQEDLFLLEALKPVQTNHPRCEINWPTHIEDEDWSKDDPVTWADCLEAQLVPSQGEPVEPAWGMQTVVTVPGWGALESELKPEPDAGLPAEVAREPDLADVDEYGSPAQVIVRKLEVGDMVLIDEDTGQWVTVSGVEADEDSMTVDLEWRDDDDDAGGLTMDESAVVTVRRPLELAE